MRYKHKRNTDEHVCCEQASSVQKTGEVTPHPLRCGKAPAGRRYHPPELLFERCRKQHMRYEPCPPDSAQVVVQPMNMLIHPCGLVLTAKSAAVAQQPAHRLIDKHCHTARAEHARNLGHRLGKIRGMMNTGACKDDIEHLTAKWDHLHRCGNTIKADPGGELRLTITQHLSRDIQRNRMCATLAQHTRAPARRRAEIEHLRTHKRHLRHTLLNVGGEAWPDPGALGLILHERTPPLDLPVTRGRRTRLALAPSIVIERPKQL